MKKILLSIIMLVVASALLAQAPQAINYQAVARDAAGNIIANQDISFRLSIMQGGPTGTVVYSESHLKTSNQFGLVNMEIGRGTIISGVFADIVWGTNTYYLKTEMDPAGGNSYQEMGTSEFLSVPYSFYSDKSGIADVALNITPHNTLDMAYDEGGPGSGRNITADAGPIQITVPAGSWNPGIDATTNVPPGWFPYPAILGNSNTNSSGGEFYNFSNGCGVNAFASGTGSAGSFYNYGAGLGVKSEADNATAIYGESNATAPTLAAGVKAFGNGPERNAAALTIKNGAIRVGGDSRPAGKVVFNGDWGNVFSEVVYEGTEDEHAHLIGYGQVKTVSNDLIVPESYILLTVFNAFSHCFAQVLFINEGSMEIKITTVGDDPPPAEVIVHYLIITPED